MPPSSNTDAPNRMGDEISGFPSIGPGTHVKWRGGSGIDLSEIESDVYYLVESGCLTCDGVLPAGRRQVLLVLYPGDVFHKGFLPPLPGLRISAAVTSQLLRLHADLAAQEVMRAGAMRLLARSCLHATARGRLSAEQRLTTLLVELALHLGKPANGGCAFDIPLSRRDMADFLALNPDSLSRLMSRLKARELIVMPTRHRGIAKDFSALKAATPLSGTLLEMRQGATAP